MCKEILAYRRLSVPDFHPASWDYVMQGPAAPFSAEVLGYPNFSATLFPCRNNNR
jgi:hypothetical protein